MLPASESFAEPHESTHRSPRDETPTTDRSGIRPGREGRGGGGRGRSGVLTLSSLPRDSVAIAMLEPGAAKRGGGRWRRGAASLEYGGDLGAGDSRLLEPAPLPESRLPPDSDAPAPGCAEDEARPGCGSKRRRMGGDGAGGGRRMHTLLLDAEAALEGGS
jgi:hypothetical protein